MRHVQSHCGFFSMAYKDLDKKEKYRLRRIELYNTPEGRKGQRDRTLKYKFGISLEKYNEMFAAQNGCCKTCCRHQSELSKILVVDHCHDNGQVRGLLCDYCNRLLGNYENKPELFRAFDAYLNSSKLKLVK